MRPADLLYLLRDIRHRLDGAAPLAWLAKRAGWSPFHLQRAFRRVVGESPKQYTQRLRLERSAAALLASRCPVVQVARASGFASHEVFTRAFRRQFGCTPAQYRTHALAGLPLRDRVRHAAIVHAAGPCVRLHHFRLVAQNRRPTMAVLSITRQERAAQPVLLIRRRVARDELQGMLAECFGKLFGHGQKAGLPIAGWPLARYVSMGPGRMIVEAAMPLAAPVAGEGEMEAGFLHAGAVALAVHAGPYDTLSETHLAIDRWIEDKGYRVAGAPWEQYVTDPGDHPDPKDWRTEVYWPLAE
jgi:AraC family transcriptional regulator